MWFRLVFAILSLQFTALTFAQTKGEELGKENEMSATARAKMMRRLKKMDLSRINAGLTLPKEHPYMGWKVDGKLAGVTVYTTGVAAYDIDMGKQSMREVAQIPIGTRVTLEKILTYNGRLFYSGEAKRHERPCRRLGGRALHYPHW